MNKKKSNRKTAFINVRTLAALILCLFGVALSLFAAGVLPAPNQAQRGLTSTAASLAAQAAGRTSEFAQSPNGPVPVYRDFKEKALVRAGKSFTGDLRKLPFVPQLNKFERPELEEPDSHPGVFVAPNGATSAAKPTTAKSAPSTAKQTINPPSLSAPAPAPNLTFDGLDFNTWGAGHPPDTNGDVGPTYYIETVNTSIGIFQKNGTRVAAFTFNTFMSQGQFGNLCDTNNFGDPVVVYDSFEDRWIITDFAFTLSGNTVTSNTFQCFAVSRTGDPVNGGWNFYYIVTGTGGALGDYPKFGIWPDGLYMSSNVFGPSGSFSSVELWALNKAQMYAGAPTVQVVTFNAPSAEFTLLPANARLQTGTPPAGSPNYFAVVWQFLNGFSVYKFHVDWNNISLSSFTGPFSSLDTFWWAQYNRGNTNPATSTVPTPANPNDSLYPRLMMQNQYVNMGGIESLWACHTVGGGTNPNPTSNVTSTTTSGVRYYQVNVTGGSVGANTTQSFTYSPDTTLWRYMPSIAVDRAGDMAIGYSTSNATTNPALQYAGQLAGDSPNTITQTEQLMFQGTGAQSGNCGSGTCTRWGDYSAMSIDPSDGCTFWYTNEYYATNGLNDLTRIGSFKYPQCTPVGAGGTISGTVTDASTTNPISGATVMLGSGRSTTTDLNGNYSFTSIPAGTYSAGMTATFPGYNTGSVSSVTVTDNVTTTQNFALTAAPTSGCPADASQTAFQMGIPTNVDLTTTPGSVLLLNNTAGLDQQNTNLGNSGFGVTTSQWLGQTFTPSATGQLVKMDVSLFCSSCSGANPSVTVDVRTTSGGLPTSTVLASMTIPGFSGGAAVFYTGTFSSPPTLTGGTLYAYMVRLVTARTTGNYDATFSATNPYSAGNLVFTTNGGGSFGSIAGDDLGFRTYMNTGYVSSGNLISSAKDANPGIGSYPTWTTLSWSSNTPAGTNVRFQAAASNNAAGVFNYVGPDSTANTFFSNGGSLSQFNGMRYLRYKALLSTTSSSSTPSLTNATVCFQDLAPAPALVSAFSRMTHTGYGAFDLGLPLNGSGIEPRDGSGTDTIVLRFDKPVNSGNATVTGGTGSVNGITFSGTDMIISLTGVTDQQRVTVTATNVSGPNTQTQPSASITAGFLIGDVNGDGVINVGDTIVVRNNSGAMLNSTNFTSDVNIDGAVNIGDTTIVRNNSGNFLP